MAWLPEVTSAFKNEFWIRGMERIFNLSSSHFSLSFNRNSSLLRASTSMKASSYSFSS